jgi:hypothetical protein
MQSIYSSIKIVVMNKTILFFFVLMSMLFLASCDKDSLSPASSVASETIPNQVSEPVCTNGNLIHRDFYSLVCQAADGTIFTVEIIP